MDTTETIDAAAMKLGFRSLKPEQREAIHNLMMEKMYVMVVLPTGFGKSLCYVLLTMSRPHATGSRCWYFEFTPTRTQQFLLSVNTIPTYITQWIIIHFLYKVL